MKAHYLYYCFFWYQKSEMAKSQGKGKHQEACASHRTSIFSERFKIDNAHEIEDTVLCPHT